MCNAYLSYTGVLISPRVSCSSVWVAIGCQVSVVSVMSSFCGAVYGALFFCLHCCVVIMKDSILALKHVCRGVHYDCCKLLTHHLLGTLGDSICCGHFVA